MNTLNDDSRGKSKVLMGSNPRVRVRPRHGDVVQSNLRKKQAIIEEQEQDASAMEQSIREVPIGKGLYGTLKHLQGRGTLKESIELSGRNTDNKKIKFMGVDDDGSIRIDRLDEFGRTMTPKEAFRELSYRFHGKRPGKKKQEKRIQTELKLKQMINSDGPSRSVERMWKAQKQLKRPYIVLSDHVL
uniref:SART-1 family protein n=1 Tax=Fagus sylvatica TaxID=28930 RepID=A0A2N9GCL4_FAGSY